MVTPADIEIQCPDCGACVTGRDPVMCAINLTDHFVVFHRKRWCFFTDASATVRRELEKRKISRSSDAKSESKLL